MSIIFFTLYCICSFDPSFKLYLTTYSILSPHSISRACMLCIYQDYYPFFSASPSSLQVGSSLQLLLHDFFFSSLTSKSRIRSNQSTINTSPKVYHITLQTNISCHLALINTLFPNTAIYLYHQHSILFSVFCFHSLFPT